MGVCDINCYLPVICFTLFSNSSGTSFSKTINFNASFIIFCSSSVNSFSTSYWQGSIPNSRIFPFCIFLSQQIPVNGLFYIGIHFRCCRNTRHFISPPWHIEYLVIADTVVIHNPKFFLSAIYTYTSPLH